MNINTTAQNTVADALLAKFDGGTFTFHPAGAGGQPASANTAVAGDQTALATITPLPASTFVAAANGTAGLNPAVIAQISDANVDIAGTATWMRATAPSGEVMDFSVSGVGGGGEIVLGADAAGNQLQLNQPINFTALNITHPA